MELEGTVGTPRNVPQTYQYLRENIFVRECYLTYYTRLLKQIKEKPYITVTGTPGIGKSVFYLYFFQRYREEFSDQQVITAAFNNQQELMECLRWNSLDEIAKGKTEFEILEKIPHREKCLHLYDGPPANQPREKMIAFTSPHRDWLKHAAKIEAHLRIYMPNWTDVELKMASDVLDLGLDENTVKRRMALFGGTARYVLTNDMDFVNIGREELESGLSAIESISDVKACFEKRLDLAKVVHRLLHYKVDENDWKLAELKPASKVVATMIHEQLNRKLDDDRQTLIRWLDGAGKASTFAGWVFENYVHEKLLAGGDFPMKLLGESSEAPSPILSMPTTGGHYKRFKVEVPLNEALVGAYQMPEASNLQSVDSYIRIGSIVWLFQITRSVEHDVDLEGIISILKYVNCYDDVKKNSNLARLVFVVPMEYKDTYRKQRLIVPAGLHGTEAEILAGACDQITGIGPDRKRKLSAIQGINTVGQLLQASDGDPDVLKFVRGAVKRFKNSLESLNDFEAFKRIPQYVIGVECFKA